MHSCKLAICGIPGCRCAHPCYGTAQGIGGTAGVALLAGQAPGEYVTIIFESRFAGKSGVIEAVTTVLDKDGRWRVTGYSAQ